MSLALRLALRQVKFARLRAVLLVLVLAVPLSMATYWFTLRATSDIPVERQVTWAFGESQAKLQNPDLFERSSLAEGDRSGEQALLSVLPPGSVLRAEVLGSTDVVAPGARLTVSLHGLERSTFYEGRFLQVAGRWPERSDEVALSAATARALNVQVGSKIAMGTAQGSFSVVGVLRRASSLDSRFAVATPSAARLSAFTRSELPSANDVSPSISWDLERPLTQAEATSLEDAGWLVRARSTQEAQIRAETSGGDITNVWLLGIALVVFGELTLIISGAYSLVMASARREHALLDAAGASPAFSKSVARWDGLIIGLCAVVLGLSVGLAAARVAAPRYAAHENQVWEDFQVPIAWLGAVSALCVFAAVAAASFAASSETAQHTGLGATSPRLGTPRRVVALAAIPLGAAGLVAGAVLGSAGVSVVATVTFGIGLVQPLRALLLRSSGPSRWVGGVTARLAQALVRTAPGRSVMFACVTASLVLLTTVCSAALGGSAKAAELVYFPAGPSGSVTVFATRPVSSATAEGAASLLGQKTVGVFNGVAPPRPTAQENEPVLSYWGEFSVELTTEDQRVAQPLLLCVGDVVDVEALLQRPLSSTERGGFEAGTVLVTDPALLSAGRTQVVAPDPRGNGGTPVRKTLQSQLIEPDGLYRSRPVAIISEAGLDSMGAVRQTNTTLVYIPPATPDALPSDRQEAQARSLLSAEVGQQFFLLDVERGSPAARSTLNILLATTMLMLVAVCALSMLTVGLAANETRPLLLTLEALGAESQRRASLVAAHVSLLNGTGALLGLGVGLASASSLLIALRLPFSVWFILGGAAAVALTMVCSIAVGLTLGARFGRTDRAMSIRPTA